MANIYLICHQILLCLTFANSQMFFDDDIIEDDVDFIGMAGFIGANGATELPTVTPTKVIVETVTPSTSYTIAPTSTYIPMSSTVLVCPPLPAPGNGSVTINCNQIQCVAVFQCNKGFQLTGQANIKCKLDEGTWESAPPTCVPRNCGFPPVANGLYRGNTYYGDEGEIQCDENYGLGDQLPTISCGETGWSTIPDCTFAQCGNFTTPANGNSKVDCRDLGCNATVECDTGYQASPASVVRCINGGWGNSVVCVDQGQTASFPGSLSFNLPNTEFNAAYKNEVEDELSNYLAGQLGGNFLGFVITDMDPLTGELTFEVYVKDNQAAKKKLAESFSALAKDSPTDIFGRNVTADFTVLDGLLSQVNDSVTDAEAACNLFLHLVPEGCPGDTECAKEGDEVVCLPSKKKQENIPLIVGLSVGIPVALLALATAVCCCCGLCCRAGAKASDDESTQYSSMAVGWLPRFRILPSRLNTKGMPSYLYQGSSNFSSNDSDTSSSKPRSRSKSKSRDSEDPFISNFSWDNMFHYS